MPPDQIKSSSTVTLNTTDTDFAAAMMAKGGHLVAWNVKPTGQQKRMEWHIERIQPEWIEEYRMGNDGFSSYIHARKMLLNIAKTDSRLK